MLYCYIISHVFKRFFKPFFSAVPSFSVFSFLFLGEIASRASWQGEAKARACNGMYGMIWSWPGPRPRAEVRPGQDKGKAKQSKLNYRASEHRKHSRYQTIKPLNYLSISKSILTSIPIPVSRFL